MAPISLMQSGRDREYTTRISAGLPAVQSLALVLSFVMCIHLKFTQNAITDHP
jgi:hypothetical protein